MGAEATVDCELRELAVSQLNSMLGRPEVAGSENSGVGSPGELGAALTGMDTRRVYIARMTKKLIRHGNSAALVLDKVLLDLLKVQMDTPLEVTTDGRNIIISPQVDERAEATLLAALDRINRKQGSVLAKLAK